MKKVVPGSEQYICVDNSVTLGGTLRDQLRSAPQGDAVVDRLGSGDFGISSVEIVGGAVIRALFEVRLPTKTAGVAISSSAATADWLRWGGVAGRRKMKNGTGLYQGENLVIQDVWMFSKSQTVPYAVEVVGSGLGAAYYTSDNGGASTVADAVTLRLGCRTQAGPTRDGAIFFKWSGLSSNISSGGTWRAGNYTTGGITVAAKMDQAEVGVFGPQAANTATRAPVSFFVDYNGAAAAAHSQMIVKFAVTLIEV